MPAFLARLKLTLVLIVYGVVLNAGIVFCLAQFVEFTELSIERRGFTCFCQSTNMSTSCWRQGIHALHSNISLSVEEEEENFTCFCQPTRLITCSKAQLPCIILLVYKNLFIKAHSRLKPVASHGNRNVCKTGAHATKRCALTLYTNQLCKRRSTGSSVHDSSI